MSQLLLAFVLLSNAQSTTNMADKFKSFVSEPPNIVDLVYTFGRRPIEYRDDGVAFQSTNFVYRTYHARWQPNAFYFREIANQHDLTNHVLLDTLVARIGGEYWHIDHGGPNGSYYYCPPAASVTNKIHEASIGTPIASAWQTEILGLLRLGVKSVGQNRISWRDDTFESITEVGNGVVGRASMDEKNRIGSLDLYYSASKIASFGDGMHFVIKYEYSTNKGVEYLPNVIRIEDGFGNSQYVYQIHKLIVSTELQPLTAFQISGFLTNVPMPLKVYSNGNWYLAGLSSSPAKRLIRLTPAAGPASPLPSYWVRPAIIILAILSALLLFGIGGRQKTKK